MSLNGLTDAELITKFLSEKDVTAFAIIYDRYGDKVYGRCLSFTQDADLAKDYVQEIFIKILYKLKEIKELKYFSTWLYSLTYRYCIDEHRKLKNIFDDDSKLETVYEIENEDENELFLKEIQYELLKEAIEILSQEERTLLLMMYQDDLSITEIQGLTGLGSSAIKMRLKRSRDKIRTFCQEKLKRTSV